MWNEFKQFALRGNVVDLVIGIIAWIPLLLIKSIKCLTDDKKTGNAKRPPEIPADVKLLTGIRDRMKGRRPIGSITGFDRLLLFFS